MAAFYKIGTTATLGTTLDASVANSKISSTAVSGSLVADTYYAYKDGYTYNSYGSQQNTSNGYRIMVVFRFKSTTTRDTRLFIAVFFRRTDGYASNNTLNLTSEINGISRSKTLVGFKVGDTTSWVMAWKQDIPVSYNSAGTATFTVTYDGGNGGSCSDIVCSFKVSAPPISASAKTATFTLSSTSVNLGSSLTLTQSHTTNIKTNISVSVGGESDVFNDVIATGNTSTSIKYTPPLSLANYLPSSTAATANFSCVTYQTNGTTKVGTKSYTATFNVPSTVKYSITSLVTSGAPSGGYKIGVDKPKVAVTVDSSAAYGATISKIVVNFGNATVTVNSPTISNKVITVQSTAAVSSSNQSITATITDSRGRTASKSITITASEVVYTPAITSLTVHRTNSAAGTASSSIVNNDQGVNCRVQYTAKISGSTSAIAITVQYKKITGSFSTFAYTAPSNTGTVSGDFVIPINDSENAYVIRITATNSAQSVSTYREASLSSSFILLDFRSTGKGIAIGASSSEDKFLVGMESRFDGVVKFTNTVYNSAGSAALTSDERKKNSIKSLSSLFTEDMLLTIFKNLEPIMFKYNDQKNDLTHFGFSANKIKELLDGFGLDSSKYSIVEEIEELVTDPETEEKSFENYLTLRYDALIPLLFMMIKILLRELNNINIRLEQLEEES